MFLATPFVTVVSLSLALLVEADLYPKSSSVLSIDGKDYDRLIAQSNYTSIVEYYSPHCIHCKNLMPIYEKAAQRLAGLAKVAAVNCEKESNRAFCDRAGIRGFPTINIVKPGKTPGKPKIEEYSGARSVKALVETVIDKIPNLVEKPSEENLQKWIQDEGENTLAILFTNKPRINPLLKALAIEFKGGIKFAHVLTSIEGEGKDKYEIAKLPTLMLIKDGKIAESLRYDGLMKKDALVEFLSQGATPNPDPAPLEVKKSASQPPKDEAKKPIATPASVPPLTVMEKEDELVTQCLGPKTGTCVIAFLPGTPDKTSLGLVEALTQLTHKRKKQGRSNIPAFVLPEANPRYAIIKDKLSIQNEALVLAINGKRSWWRQLSDADLSSQSATENSLEKWISAIQLGEGEKKKLPDSLVLQETEHVIIDIDPENVSPEVKKADETGPIEAGEPSSNSGSSEGDENSEEITPEEEKVIHNEL